MNNYRVENRGFLTQSKLKVFKKCPASFEKMFETETYVLDDDEDKYLEGRAFHDFFHLGKEKWLQKYEILEPRQKRQQGGKEQLTNSMGIVLLRAINEVMRQPIFDIHGNYETEVVLKVGYNGLMIKGSLDRFDKKNAIIRDFKFMKSVKDFEWAILDFEYIYQMAFYNLLAKINYGIDCECIIDVVDKTDKSCSSSYKIDKHKIQEEQKRIIQDLNWFQDTKKNDTWKQETQKKGRCGKDCPTYDVCENALQYNFVII